MQIYCSFFIPSNSLIVLSNFNETATWSTGDEDWWRNHLQDAFYGNLMNFSAQLRNTGTYFSRQFCIRVRSSIS